MTYPVNIRIQPAKEAVRCPGYRVFFATWMFSIGIVLLCNIGAGQLLDNFSTNRGYALIQAKWELLKGLKRPVDILIVGDSSCNQGIIPRVFYEEARSSAINLCTVGDMITLDDYWMLNDYIGRFGAPMMVIMGHVYDSWHRSNLPVLLARTPIVDGISILNIAPLEMQWREYALFLVGKYVPLIAGNRSLAKILMYPWRASRFDLELFADGFFGPKRPDPENVVRDSDNHREFVRVSKFNMSRDNRLALDRISELSKTHGFDVYIVNAPMYEVLSEDPGIKSYLAEVEKFFNQYTRENRNLHYLFAEPLLFSDTEMQNADHLILEAADGYTRSIWNTIKALRQSNPKQ